MKFAYSGSRWQFQNETLSVTMDDATFQRYLDEHLKKLGIDTRTYLQLMDYAIHISSLRLEAAKTLNDPEYWRNCVDPQVTVYAVHNGLLLPRRLQEKVSKEEEI